MAVYTCMSLSVIMEGGASRCFSSTTPLGLLCLRIRWTCRACGRLGGQGTAAGAGCSRVCPGLACPAAAQQMGQHPSPCALTPGPLGWSLTDAPSCTATQPCSGSPTHLFNCESQLSETKAGSTKQPSECSRTHLVGGPALVRAKHDAVGRGVRQLGGIKVGVLSEELEVSPSAGDPLRVLDLILQDQPICRVHRVRQPSADCIAASLLWDLQVVRGLSRQAGVRGGNNACLRPAGGTWTQQPV